MVSPQPIQRVTFYIQFLSDVLKINGLHQKLITAAISYTNVHITKGNKTNMSKADQE